MAPPLVHKRRVRVDTSLPEPAPRRRAGIPIIGLGLVAWLVAVIAGAALVDPAGAARWYRWTSERWGQILIPSAATERASPVPPQAAVRPMGAAGAGPSPPPPPSATGTGGEVADLVVQEQSGGGAAATPTGPARMTCEGAIRAYRDAVLSGDAGPPRPVGRDGHAAILENGIYLRECDVGDDLAVDVCAAIREGRVVGVTIQTAPHRPAVARCLARAVLAIELEDAEPTLDVTQVRFEPRWR